MNIVSMNVPMPDGKRGRIFGQTQAVCEAAVVRLVQSFEDDDDKLRAGALSELLEHDHIIARVHPTVGDLCDIMQIYLFAADDQSEEHPLFACTMAAQSRVEKDLTTGDTVLESASFQVLDSTEPLRLSGDEARIRIGLLAWMDRVFPKLTPPREIEIKPYNEALACGWAYAQYTDDEEWIGPFDTREGAIREGADECTEERTFFVAPARWNKIDDGLDAETIIEQLHDRVGDDFGEYASLALESRVTAVARAELDEFLFRWAKKHLSKLYWTVDGKREEIVRADVAKIARST